VDDDEAAEDSEIAKLRNDQFCTHYPDMPFADIQTIGELRDYIEKALRRGVSRDAQVFYTIRDEFDEIETTNITCSFNDDDGPDCPPFMIIEKSDEDQETQSKPETKPNRPKKADQSELKATIAAKDHEIAVKDRKIADKDGEIADNEREIAGLYRQIDDLQRKIAAPASSSAKDQARIIELEAALAQSHRGHETADSSLRRALNAHKGWLTTDENRKLRACFHPDKVSEKEKTKYEEASKIFNQIELALMKREERPPAPRRTTQQDWDAMKRAKKQTSKTKPPRPTKPRHIT
jgi:hypothetical protein